MQNLHCKRMMIYLVKYFGIMILILSNFSEDLGRSKARLNIRPQMEITRCELGLYLTAGNTIFESSPYES